MLKSNKGITLISLVVYIIVLMIVIALMSGMSRYFYKNVNQITVIETGDEQFTRLLAYLTKDINQNSMTFVKTETDDDIDYMIFKFENDIEHQYIYQNQTIYYIDKNKDKKILLCNNVSSCIMTYNDTSKTIEISININNKAYSKTLKVNI